MKATSKFILLALMGLFVFFGARAEGQGFRGYAETKFSAATCGADSDTVLTPMLTKDCEWTNIEIITGTETGAAVLTVTWSTSIDSVSWVTATPQTITTATATQIYFTPITSTASQESSKWLRIRLSEIPATGTYASIKVLVHRGCWADPHQVANW